MVDRGTPVPEFRARLQQLRDLQHDPEAQRPLTVEVDLAYLHDLCTRLESQPAIEQAKGVLMSAYRMDADRAFATLVRWSQAGNIRIRDLAKVLVDGQTSSRSTPAELIAAHLSSSDSSPSET